MSDATLIICVMAALFTVAFLLWFLSDDDQAFRKLHERIDQLDWEQFQLRVRLSDLKERIERLEAGK